MANTHTHERICNLSPSPHFNWKNQHIVSPLLVLFFAVVSMVWCISETIKSTVCWQLSTHNNFHGHLNIHIHTHSHALTHMPNVCTCNITSGNRIERDIVLIVEDKSKQKFNMRMVNFNIMYETYFFERKINYPVATEVSM